MKCISYARRRFPPDVIRHAVWLYLRFTQDIEYLLAEKGLEVSNESIRRWVLEFGSAIARNLRSIRPRPHDHWHLGEMVVSIGGQRMYMWRAVDGEGEVLDVLIQRSCDKAAALKLLRKLLKKPGFAPAVIVTDKLRSHGAALRTIGFSGRHEPGLRANNRAENSHQPVRRREHKMGGFKSSKSAQRFVSLHAPEPRLLVDQLGSIAAPFAAAFPPPIDLLRHFDPRPGETKDPDERLDGGAVGMFPGVTGSRTSYPIEPFRNISSRAPPRAESRRC